MAYDPGAIDAALAAAVGDEPALIAELHAAFRASAGDALHAMVMAIDGESWRSAAWRLKGLAASFGAIDLLAAATDAAECGVGNAAALDRLRTLVAAL